MKRYLALLSLLAAAVLSSSVAHAASCGKWVTEFGTLAGEGEALNTSFCSEAAGQNYQFEITCSGQSLNVRFMPQFESDALSIDKVMVDYAIDGQSHMVETQFEELDGAFAANVASGDPLVKAMMAGKSASVTLKDIKAAPYQVSLKGFSKAINKLIRQCS